jgi:hypothetical protein
VRPALLLAILVGAAVAVRGALALVVPAPAIFIDELLHAELARNLLDGEWLRVRGERLPISAAYALGTALAWLPSSTETGYALAKLAGTVWMCLTAVPVWLLARRSAGPRWALLAAGLTLLLPVLALTGTLMLETVALPLFVLAAWAIAAALERPTAARQLAALGAIALASLARFQGLLLLPILATAIVLFAVIERRGARAWLPSVAGIAGVAAVWAGVRLTGGDPLVPTLGVYEGHAAAEYEPGEVLRWTFATLGALVLATGVAPALALVLLAVERVRARRAPSNSPLQSPLSAYLAVTIASVAWLTALAAVAAAWEPDGLKERYAVYAEPLVVGALPIWLARGAPRPRVAAGLAALGTVALVAALPVGRILDAPSFLGNAYGLLLLDRLGGAGGAAALATLAAAALAAAMTLAPARALRTAVPAAVAALLVAGSSVATDTVLDRARGADAFAPEPRRFADDAIGGEPRALYLNATAFRPETGRGRSYEQWLPYWQAELWNRSLAGTANLGLAEPAPIAQRPARVDWPTGRIELDGPAPPYVLTDRRMSVRGRPVASAGPFVLVRVNVPLRLATFEEGIDADGYTVGGAAFDVYDERVGAVDVVVEADAPTDVEVVSGDLVTQGATPALGPLRALARGRADSGSPARVRVAAFREPARVEVRLSRTPARVRFVPAYR